MFFEAPLQFLEKNKETIIVHKHSQMAQQEHD